MDECRRVAAYNTESGKRNASRAPQRLPPGALPATDIALNKVLTGASFVVTMLSSDCQAALPDLNHGVCQLRPPSSTTKAQVFPPEAIVRRTAFTCVWVVLSLLLFSAAFAQPSKMDARVRIAAARLRSGQSPRQVQADGVAVSASGDLDVFIRGSISAAELEAMGVIIRTQLPGLYTAYIPVDDLDAVAANAQVISIRAAVKAEQNLNASLPTTGADLLRGPGPTFTGLNGAGVLVGDVDTGIDIHHGDFKDAGGLSRILYLWDQNATGTPPSGFSIGTEWTKAQIDLNVCTETDADGHGSHVMGIAAGDGSQTGGATPQYTYVGMAPKADIAMVATTFFTTDILDGVNYIMQRATALGENASVNLSLGSEFGPHDGTSDFESGLSALTGPGRIISVAAGNDRGTNWHAGFVVPAGGDSAKLTVTSGTNLPLGNPTVAVDGYYNDPDDMSITLRSPSNVFVGPISLGSINAAYPGTLLTGSANVYIENGAFLTSTGAREVYIELTRTSASHAVAGTWTIYFTPNSVSNGRVDMWKFYSGAGTSVFSLKNTNDHLVSEPGNALDVITVAAFATKNTWIDCGGTGRIYSVAPTIGDIASFSGLGPTRDGRQKPDITAPGFGVASTRSFDVALTCGGATGNAPFLVNDGGNHIINQGTSMAAPHVTGAAAILLEKFGAWTPAQIKTYLNSHATIDGFTGLPWNSSWGNGKLHLGDLLNPTVAVVAANGGEVWFIADSHNLQWTAADNVGVTSVDLLLSRNGTSGPWETIATGIPNSGNYAWTVSGPATNNAILQVVAHDAENNSASDNSDYPFAILGAETGTLLATFDANPVAAGIQLRWELGSPGMFSSMVVDRASNAVGPWQRLNLTTTRDGNFYQAVDASVVSGQSYQYRLTGLDSKGNTTMLGQISGTAGEAITRFELTRIAPNPTHDFARVEFTVPVTAPVKVSVLDIAGREVATLVSGPQAPGRHQVVWSGELSGHKAVAGVYFIRFEAPGGIRTTRRVSMIR